MNWYGGNIAEAVATSRKINAIFVVYIEGSDDLTQKLTNFINESKIKSKLETDDFVAIKISSNSQAYMQFAKIYQVVPVPSIFFIGNSGTPLEIGTGMIASSDELEKKIDSVLKQAGKKVRSTEEANTTATFIASERTSEEIEASTTAVAGSSTLTEVLEATEVVSEDLPGATTFTKAAEGVEGLTKSGDGSETFKNTVEEAQILTKTVEEAETIKSTEVGDESLSTTEPGAPKTADNNSVIQPNIEDTSKMSCVDDICQSNDQSTTNSKVSSSNAENIVKELPGTKNEEPNERLQETRKLLEQKRRERIQMEKEKELQRQRQNEDVKQSQPWQKDQELKELKENLRRERLEEQAARDRIRAQIAGDRAERAKKFAQETNKGTNTESAHTSVLSTPPKLAASGNTRLQFRLPSGENKSQTFNCQDKLSVVQSFVRTDVIIGTGIRDFIMATSYPKFEFGSEHCTQSLLDLGLYPNAVIMVIPKDSGISPSRVIAHSGGIANMITSIFWTLFTPVFAIYGYFRRKFGGRAIGSSQKRTNEEQRIETESPKRRNLGDPSTSRDSTSPVTKTHVPSGGVENDSNDSQPYRRYVGGSNIHRLSDKRKDSDDENATWNGNSTQQQ